MTVQDDVYLAALAGLLHDIGKFAQRASVGKRELTDCESLKEVKYEHALYSDSFVRDWAPEGLRKHLTAPRQHHNPQAEQDYQVQLADWLSASEREDQEDQRVPFLLSPFARLKRHQANAYLPLQRLDPTGDGIFPAPGEPPDWREVHRDQYKGLWDEFTEACRGLKDEQFPLYLESLYGLMQEFTWCIPSAYYNATPDVSLFDHARTTAALAACLAADGRDGDWCREVAQALRQGKTSDAATREICLLVGGDINGVQAFIYTTTSAGAAKALRARSFYLQLLTEAVARYMLSRLDLPLTNLLYAGGGVFQLLTPVGADNELRAVRAEITERLLHIHGGALGLTLEWAAVKASDFETFGEVRRDLSTRLNMAKRRPFSAVDPKTLAQYVGQALDFDKGGDIASSCEVCGAPGPERDRKCSFCLSLESDLGNILPKATHLIACDVPPTDAARVCDWREGLHTFGSDVYLLNIADPESLETFAAGDFNSLVRVWRFAARPHEEERELLAKLRERPHVIAYRPFAQLVPHRWNGQDVEIATFDHLAGESARGIERWGVLRMDVDNLGDLFKELGSFSRTAALSRTLQLFFEGYLPTIGAAWNEFSAKLQEHQQPPHAIWGTRQEPGPRDQLYVQYAGGDDLFVVGAWDALPEFAARIRQEFARYACGNPAATLSGGVALADAKFPLYQAAEWAGDAEEAAKRFKRADGREKDAVTFLDQAVGWEQFETIQKRAADLACWCGSGLAPRALIQLLLAIDAEWRRGLRPPDDKTREQVKPHFYFGRWMWQLVYYLTRAAKRSENQEVVEGIGELEKALLDKEGIATIGLIARWSELLVRKS